MKLHTFALAALMLGATANAQAADLGTRLVTGLGNVIATQGNNAFYQIRADLTNEIARQFDSWVPDLTAPAAEADGMQAEGDVHTVGASANVQ